MKKLFTLFLLLLPLIASAQNLTLNVSVTPLKDVLSDITAQTGYKFVYTSALSEIERPVSIKCTNMPLKQVLEKILKGKAVFKIEGKTIALTPLELAPKQPITTDKGTLKGKVKDDVGYMSGVSVVVKNENIYSITDEKGNFTLENVPYGAELEFSFLGYENSVLKYNGQKNVEMVMKSQSLELDETIVVAYGTAKKSTFTGSTSTIKSDKLTKISGTSVAEALQGVSAGVNVVNEDGVPGGNTNITIRGIGSITGSTAPLIVVDGMPFAGNLSSIPSSDIDNMTILKDAAAASLYGSRAANGVVMITTKKGNSEKPIVNFKMSWGTSDMAVPTPTKANPYQHIENTWEGIYNDQFYVYGKSDAEARKYASGHVMAKILKKTKNSKGESIYVSPFANMPDDQYVLENGKANPALQMIWNKEDWDWASSVFNYRLRQEYSIDVSGMSSSGKTNYFFSASYLDDNGFSIRSYFKRYSFRANVSSKITNWLELGANVSYSNGKQNASGFVRALDFATTMASPWLRNKDNTDWEYSEKTGVRMFCYGSYANNFVGWLPNEDVGDYWFGNPNDYNFNNYMNDLISSRFFVNINLPFDIKFRSNISIDNNHYNRYWYESAIHGADQLQPYGVTVKTAGGRTYRWYNRTNPITFNNLLSWDTMIGDHSINAMIGQELYTLDLNINQSSGAGIMQPGQYELSSTTRQWRVDSSRDKYGLLSFFGKIDYGFRNKYFISGSYRVDGSSKFHPDNRWGNFFSVGASWRISNEKFMNNAEWINSLLLRGSYGTSGNDGNNYYAYQGTYTEDNFLNYPGLKPSTLATPNLRWEKNVQFNVALDFSLLDNRLNGTFEYYQRRSNDLLYYKELPPSSQVGNAEGINSNLGDIMNSGFEFTIGAKLIQKKNFTWTVDANWSSLKNVIVNLPSGAYTYKIITATYKMEEGKSRYEFYLPRNAGVNPDNGNMQYWITDDNGNKVKTENYTNVKSSDYEFCGSALPKGFGSISSAFNFYGIDLSFMIYYSYGGKLYDQLTRERTTLRGGVGNTQDLIQDRWQKPGDNATYPRWSNDNYGATNKNSDFYLFDNSYARLRNVTLGYTLPKSIVSYIGASNIRFYINGDNLLTFGSAVKRHVDPETGVAGNNYEGNGQTESGRPSSRRVYMGGIQITF